jgi:hypothetical protein
MTTRHGFSAALLVLVLATAARAQEPTEEEKRAEAHRTVLRRFSKTEGAETRDLGLPPSSCELIDLLLDTARNEAEARAGRAPRSRMFRGVAHGVTKVEDGKLDYSACFVNLVIDRAEVPLSEVPALLEAALDAKRFRCAALERDGDAFEGRRLGLMAMVAAGVHRDMASRKSWAPVRDRVADELLAALPAVSGVDPSIILKGLQIIGDDRVAKALIARAASLTGPASDRLRRTVFLMDTPAARRHAQEALRGDDLKLATSALYALGGRADPETLEFMERVVAPDSKSPAMLRRAAIHGLERQGTDRARRILEHLFTNAANETERYSMACAATRAGSPKAVPYLRKKLEEFEGSGQVQDVVKANVVRRILAQYEERAGEGGTKR